MENLYEYKYICIHQNFNFLSSIKNKNYMIINKLINKERNENV